MVCFLVGDDMIDGALTRRGKPCWYTLPNIGYSAAKDALLIYQSMMELLNIHFGKTPFYNDMISLINETVYQVSMGEYLDCSSGYNKEKNNIDVLTMDRCNTIAMYKSACYWLKLPIFLALFLIRDRNKKATEELNYICITLGRLLQLQDDYIDAYGDETVTGKNGRDIQEGKCSWLAATAVERCNKAQITIYKEYYGSKEPEHVKQIKQLYDELKLNKMFEQYERTVCDDLVYRIHALPTERETQFLLDHLNLYYYKRLY